MTSGPADEAENGAALLAGIDPVPRVRHLPQELARQIGEQIEAGALQPGARLPTEAALCRQFGVSRAVVREAIARLKMDGLVATRHGVGAFVAKDLSQRPFRLGSGGLGEEELRQIFEFRTEIEAAAAALAARRATAEQLARVETALAAMARAIARGEDGVQPDIDFHVAIAESTNNDIFRDFTMFVAGRLRGAVATARSNSARSSGLPEQVQGEHAAVVAALKDRNGERAARAMRAHLEGAMGRLGLLRDPAAAQGGQAAGAASNGERNDGNKTMGEKT